MSYNYQRLEPTNDSHEKPQGGTQESLPLERPAVPASGNKVVEPTVPSPILQQNVTPEPTRTATENQQTNGDDAAPVRVINTPLLTREVEQSELGVFEDRTLRYARWTIIVGVVTLLVILGTAVVFWDQFQEMAAQTDILAISTRQARRDSAESSIATQKQLALAQQQIASAQRQAKAAQDSANAIQRQTEIGARPWLELSEIALTGPMTINMNGEARTQVHAIATNIGKTPAREVSLWVELGEHATEHQEIRRLCTMSLPTPTGAGKYGQILFPTKTLGKEENQTISIKLKRFTLVERKQVGTGYQESIRLDKNGPPPSQEQFIYSIPSSVVGCIQYKSFTSDIPYYTGFIYEIYPPMKGIEMLGYNIHFDRKTGIASDIPSTIPQENGTVTIPIEWLRLTQNRGWGNDIVK